MRKNQIKIKAVLHTPPCREVTSLQFQILLKRLNKSAFLAATRQLLLLSGAGSSGISECSCISKGTIS